MNEERQGSLLVRSGLVQIVIEFVVIVLLIVVMAIIQEFKKSCSSREVPLEV